MKSYYNIAQVRDTAPAMTALVLVAFRLSFSEPVVLGLSTLILTFRDLFSLLFSWRSMVFCIGAMIGVACARKQCCGEQNAGRECYR